MKRMLAVLLVLVFSVLLTACGSTTAPTATAVSPPATAEPTVASTATSAPAATVAPAATSAPAATDAPAPATDMPEAAEGDAENGALLFARNGCSGCHGAQAGGAIGPALAGRGLEVEFVLGKVRAGPSDMPAFTADQVSDADVHDIVAWLSSL